MKTALMADPKFSFIHKMKVGVVRGGTSAERRISLRSGRAVTRALQRIGVSVFPIDPKHQKTFLKKVSQADILFIALHGKGGEDGVIQRQLSRQKKVFTGSSASGCQKSFDKLISKRFFVQLGIPTPEYKVIRESNWNRVASTFPAPYFVKPLDGGSSQGVFCVEDFKKSAEKIKRSLKRFGTLLLEKKIVGRELTAGILENLKLPIVEVKPLRAFYDYKAKYTKGMTTYEVPAKIPANVAKRVQEIAYRVYRGLGLSGFSRVDVMLDQKNRPFVLEVNTIPGLTEFSLLPKAAAALGISFEELCLRVLRDALNK